MSDSAPAPVATEAEPKVAETTPVPVPADAPKPVNGTVSAPEVPKDVVPVPSAPAPAAAAVNGASANTSLYVGELDPSVTEAMLYEIFSMVGTVSSIRVCRDAVTRRSLGYAYVNYLNASDGERALEQLNYSLIKGKACRIMWSQRDPALRKTSAGNIFLKNLDDTIDNKALHDTFAAFGSILSCKVALDDQGNSKGYGFVHFDSGDAADAAIAAVNGMLLNDKVVYVGHHIPKRERQAKINEIRSKFTNLYIKGLSLDVTEEELRDKFAEYGVITSAVLQVDEEGKSRGFGFINFEDHEQAAIALDDLNEKEWRGNTLIVTRAQKKSEREEELRKSYEQQKTDRMLKYQGVNLYVKNLDDDIDEDKLQAEFSSFGTITSCKIMRDEKTNASKGFGFVCFSAPDEATKAVSELNGKMIGNKPLYVSLAQRKDQRKQQLETQIAQRNVIRNQQMAASGIPPLAAGYMPPGAQMYYPPAGYPQQPGARNMSGMMATMGGYPQPQCPGANMMTQRPRYAPGGMPMPMAAYPQYPGGYPRPPVPQMAGRYPSVPSVGQQQPGRMSSQANSQPPPPTTAQPIKLPAAAPKPGQPGAAAGYKLNPQTRNAPPQPQPVAGINAAALASATVAEQKQMLGEAMYPRIYETQPELAGKITGMLLEMDNSELLHLLENEEALTAKVTEAVQVLEEYTKKGGPGA